jgi:hypothetical protein
VTPFYAVSNAKGEFRLDGLAPQPWIVSVEPSLEPRCGKFSLPTRSIRSSSILSSI